jgi:hypothetical protein
MDNRGIFYDHLVSFKAIGNILWPFGIFSPVLYFVPRKIWQPCNPGNLPRASSKVQISICRPPPQKKILRNYHPMSISTIFGVMIKPGVDVMITIFGDFRPFSAKKLAFFSKTNVMIKFFQNLALI